MRGIEGGGDWAGGEVDVVVVELVGVVGRGGVDAELGLGVGEAGVRGRVEGAGVGGRRAGGVARVGGSVGPVVGDGGLELCGPVGGEGGAGLLVAGPGPGVGTRGGGAEVVVEGGGGGDGPDGPGNKPRIQEPLGQTSRGRIGEGGIHRFGCLNSLAPRLEAIKVICMGGSNGYDEKYRP